MSLKTSFSEFYFIGNHSLTFTSLIIKSEVCNVSDSVPKIGHFENGLGFRRDIYLAVALDSLALSPVALHPGQ